MMMPGPNHPCPECGANCPHHPWGDILILRCQSCGFAIGADDLHTCVENWKRRARQKTEEMGPDIFWKPGMNAGERIDLIGCHRATFDRLSKLPKGHSPNTRES